PAAADGHLDADEMNAFAEGHLSSAARAHYVSHLADCEQCRKEVSSLAIGSGAVARVEASVAKTADRSLWQKFTGWFTVPTLRYGAFAAVLLVIAGVAFIVLRKAQQPGTASMIAENQPASHQQESAITSKQGTETRAENANAVKPA